jgi:hypothetical protein
VASASGAAHAVRFRLPSTGHLGSGGFITLVAASGTQVNRCANLIDLATGQQDAPCRAVDDNGSWVGFTAGMSIGPRDTVGILIDSATNPPKPDNYTFSILTWSDGPGTTTYTNVGGVTLSCTVQCEGSAASSRSRARSCRLARRPAAMRRPHKPRATGVTGCSS